MAKGKRAQQKPKSKKRQSDPTAAIAPKRRKLRRGQPRPDIALPTLVNGDAEGSGSEQGDEDADVEAIETDQATAFLEGLDVNRIGQCVPGLRSHF